MHLAFSVFFYKKRAFICKGSFSINHRAALVRLDPSASSSVAFPCALQLFYRFYGDLTALGGDGQTTGSL